MEGRHESEGEDDGNEKESGRRAMKANGRIFFWKFFYTPGVGTENRAKFPCHSSRHFLITLFGGGEEKLHF